MTAWKDGPEQSPSLAPVPADENATPVTPLESRSYSDGANRDEAISAETARSTDVGGAICEPICDSPAVEVPVEAPAPAPVKRRPGRPRKPESHGLYTLERAVKLAARKVVPLNSAFRDALVADLGGEANLTTARLVLVDLATREHLYLNAIDAWLLRRRSLVHAKLWKLRPVLLERSRIADSLQRRLETLGLDRVRAEKRVNASEYAHPTEVQP